MDAALASLLGVALGIAGTFFGAWFQNRWNTRRWNLEQSIRRSTVESDAIAHYLAAVGAWRAQLARLWTATVRGAVLDNATFDSAAGDFYLRRYSAYLVVGDGFRALMANQLLELEELFTLAAAGCRADIWTEKWNVIDASSDGMANEARVSAATHREAFRSEPRSAVANGRTRAVIRSQSGHLDGAFVHPPRWTRRES